MKPALLLVVAKSAFCRLHLFAVTGIKIPALASKQPFTKCHFQHCEGLKTAMSRPSCCADFCRLYSCPAHSGSVTLNSIAINRW
jgi:hypothetical protein